ncbi:Protein ALP1-like [Labeo rohita]|uniref:Protein ALP1-like n=1 Tax=Labeo rohita TaxID=84645 RepID=A0ABQ8L8H6_LABRO|nr:Protein ALP1-like [Labeo rohita]
MWQRPFGIPWWRTICLFPPQKTGGTLLQSSTIAEISQSVLVVDAKYCFRIIDVGSYGKTSDGGTLANSPFGNGLRNGTLCLPEDTLLPGADHLGPQPHVFIADEAFPLRRDLMRPFPGTTLPSRHRVFNYRLSRARLTVENTFGILAAQWRIYRLVIGVSPANAEACVKATCVLHNFLWRTTGTVRYPLTPAADGEASALQNVSRVGSNNAAREAMHVRESLADYFCAEGAVPWQPQFRYKIRHQESTTDSQDG